MVHENGSLMLGELEEIHLGAKSVNRTVGLESTGWPSFSGQLYDLPVTRTSALLPSSRLLLATEFAISRGNFHL
jgi:hypothetical protein